MVPVYQQKGAYIPGAIERGQRELAHERMTHSGRPVDWWPRTDGSLECGVCHPQPGPAHQERPGISGTQNANGYAEIRQVNGGKYRLVAPSGLRSCCQGPFSSQEMAALHAQSHGWEVS